MQTLNRNQQKMWYGLLQEPQNIYKTDENGNIICDVIDGEEVPLVIGKKPAGYLVDSFKENISPGGGETEAQAYGLNIGDYDFKIVSTKGKLPITETSVIWANMPLCDENNIADGNTADYKIAGIYPSLNNVVYLLKKRTK